jgi:DNA-binding MarR family transcriptional regulator
MSKSSEFRRSLQEWAEVFMHRSMSNFVRYAKDQKLSMPQVSALMRLHHEGACGVSEIGSELGVTSAAASQMIDRLVLSDLLERSEDPDDRRMKVLRLTPKGVALIVKGREARYRWLDDLARNLTPEQQEQITTALGYLTAAARKLDRHA